ncbi:oxygenase MpaB family protein [Naumannella huperziae]
MPPIPRPAIPRGEIAAFARGSVRRARVATADAIRDRIAGADRRERAREIWATPGPRRFAPEDPIWRVHNDPAMFTGGLAALLLQSLHPLAMAGVAGHSGYRGDPWGRLQRTSDYIAATTYGTVEEADRAIARVRAIHDRVRGRDPRGIAYRASDPHLLAWVHAAEGTAFLAAYQTFGPAPLTPADADRYVAQLGGIAARLGVIDPPGDTRSLHAVIEAYRSELQVTPAARDTAAFLLREPPLPAAARPVYAGLAAGAVALLPGWARRELGLRPSRGGRLAGSGATRLTRWALTGAPPHR